LGDTNYNGAFRKVRVEMLRRGCRLRYRQEYWGTPVGEVTMLTRAAQQLLASAAAGSTETNGAGLKPGGTNTSKPGRVTNVG
jgi:hypothetical protein